MESSLAPGAEHRLEVVVGPEHTPPHLRPIVVLSTPRMVEFMEQVCLEAAQSHLGDDETTVGVHLDISHDSAAREGERVVFRCRLERVDGRRLHFSVHAAVDDQVVGAGTHDRYIVDRSRFGG